VRPAVRGRIGPRTSAKQCPSVGCGRRSRVGRARGERRGVASRRTRRLPRPWPRASTRSQQQRMPKDPYAAGSSASRYLTGAPTENQLASSRDPRGARIRGHARWAAKERSGRARANRSDELAFLRKMRERASKSLVRVRSRSGSSSSRFRLEAQRHTTPVVGRICAPNPQAQMRESGAPSQLFNARPGRVDTQPAKRFGPGRGC
jgi:hypothetical protein